MRVRDVDADRVIYAGSFVVPGFGEDLHALNGFEQSAYVPVGTSWSLGVAEPGGVFVAMYAYEHREAHATLRIHSPGLPPPGTYHLILEYDGAEHPLLTVKPQTSDTRVPVPLTDVPLDRSWLRLDYRDNGRTLLTERRLLSIGRLDVSIDPIVVDHEKGTATTTVLVRTSEPVEGDVPLSVHVTVSELHWDAHTRSYDRVSVAEQQVYSGSVDLSDGQARVSIGVTLPREPGNWELNIAPTVGLNVATYVSGQTHLVSTYPPPDIAEGDHYTIVVFPDTQYFARTYPDILTRMADWVAAHAADQNLAAVLHVGDITDANVPAQWLNAYRSMSLLHGVVPYVLAIGNHDMLDGGVIRERGRTLLNEYFSIQAAERYSNLGGTMVPGRLDNHYALFTLAGTDYLVISLEYLPPDEALAWANEVVARHPNHKVIYLTHAYLTHAGTKSTGPANENLARLPTTTVNTAFDIWDKLISHHSNSFLVLSGHASPANVSVPFFTERTQSGHVVPALLFDFQNQPSGGNGWLGLLTFHPDGLLEVRIYSPYLGVYADELDPNGFTSRLLIDTTTGKVSRFYDGWNLDELTAGKSGSR